MFRCEIRHVATHFSITFEILGKMLIGLGFSGFVLSLALNIGVTLAVFHVFGTTLCLSDRLNKSAIGFKRAPSWILRKC